MAALAKQNDTSRILLTSPDINADLKDKDGFTPLRVATCCKATEIVQLLAIRADVDVNTVDTVQPVGSFPLLFLCGTTDSNRLPRLENRTESSNVAATPQGDSVTESLIENAGNAAAKKSPTSNTLDHAVLPKGQATVESSLKKIKFEASLSTFSLATGRTPLHDAANSGYDDIVKALLARKDINTTVLDGGGMTPLHKAAKYGHLSVVKLLMERPDISGHERSNQKFGRLPIHMAAKYHRSNVVEYFLAQDEDLVNAVDNEGKTVLHHTLFKDTPLTIGSLLKHKNIKPDMKISKGEPLSAII